MAVMISVIEAEQDKSNKWVDDYTKGRNEEYKESYSEWLSEESIRQASKVIESSIIMKGRDPFGVSICEQGLESFDFEAETQDWIDIYYKSKSQELDRSSVKKVLVTAYSGAEIALQKTSNEQVLYDEADLKSKELAEILSSMINIDLPSGWVLVGELEVEVDEVSVYADKRWWEKNGRELSGACSSTLIERPIRRKSYRRK